MGKFIIHADPNWDESKVSRDSSGKFATKSEKTYREQLDEEIRKRLGKKQPDYTSFSQLPTMVVGQFPQLLKDDQFAITDFDITGAGNCPFATFAYELRRRGYDVEAKDITNGEDREDMVFYDKESIDKDPTIQTIYDMYNASYEDANRFVTGDEMVAWIDANPEEFPPNSRGYFAMPGHIHNYEVDSTGQLWMIDGQQSTLYTSPNINKKTSGIGVPFNSERLPGTSLGTKMIGDQTSESMAWQVMRTDNKELNESYLRYVRKQDDELDALMYIRDMADKGATAEQFHNIRKPLDIDMTVAPEYYLQLAEDIIHMTDDAELSKKKIGNRGSVSK